MPYWISALLFDDAASYTNLLGPEKTFYYGFPKSVEDYSYSLDDKETKGWQPFSSEQQNDTRKLFEYIQSIIDVNFVETENLTAKTLSLLVTINKKVVLSLLRPVHCLILAMYSLNFGRRQFSDSYRDGFQYANVFIHEIGHALGLKHPLMIQARQEK